MKKPISIDLIAFLPEGWDLCATCEAFIAQAELDENKANRSLEAFPPEWQADFHRLSDFILDFSQKYQQQIQIRIFDPRSLQGMGKAIRHRIHTYPAFIVSGKKKVVGLDQNRLAEFLKEEGALPHESG